MLGRGRRGKAVLRLLHAMAEWAAARRLTAQSAHLPHQHIGQTNTAALTGEVDGQLLVVHFLIMARGIAVEQAVLGDRLVGRAHGFENLVDEQRFKLLGNLTDIAFAVALLSGFHAG